MRPGRNTTFGIWGFLFILLLALAIGLAFLWWTKRRTRDLMDGGAVLRAEWARAAAVEERLSRLRRIVEGMGPAGRILLAVGDTNRLLDLPTPREVLVYFSEEDKTTSDLAILARRALAPDGEYVASSDDVADILARRTRLVEESLRKCVAGLFLSFLLLSGLFLSTLAAARTFWRWRSRLKRPEGLLLPRGGPCVKVTARGEKPGWWSPRIPLAPAWRVWMDREVRRLYPLGRPAGTALWILRVLKAHADTPASPRPGGHEGGKGGLLRHSLRVAAEMASGAESAGVDVREALVTGLAHDLGKVLAYRDGAPGETHDNLSALLLKWSPAFVREFDSERRSAILAAVGHHHAADRLPLNEPWSLARPLLDLLTRADRACAMREIRLARDGKKGESDADTG